MIGPRRRALPLATALFLAALLPATEARAEAFPYPTLPWAATQLVPSPGMAITRGHPALFLRWQVTPFLYSYALRRGLRPYRVLVAEPMTRHGGSTELFVSPEYIGLPGSFASRWGVRAGVRSYFPLVDFGEGLSVALGGAFAWHQGQASASLEGGIYTLFGILGIEASYTPRFLGAQALFLSLRVRYF